MIDLNQVSLALRNLTVRSLLIIDEFGKGTVSSGSFRQRLSSSHNPSLTLAAAVPPAPSLCISLVNHSHIHRRRGSLLRPPNTRSLPRRILSQSPRRNALSRRIPQRPPVALAPHLLRAHADPPNVP